MSWERKVEAIVQKGKSGWVGNVRNVGTKKLVEKQGRFAVTATPNQLYGVKCRYRKKIKILF